MQGYSRSTLSRGKYGNHAVIFFAVVETGTAVIFEQFIFFNGIVIDTQNFSTKTGVRTFEAAAYLRRNGADVTGIRKMFRTEQKEYMVKAQAVSSTEVYKEYYAFASLNPEGIVSPTVLSAQVANDLMNIAGLKASFVLTEFNGKILKNTENIKENDEVSIKLQNGKIKTIVKEIL